MSTDTIEQVAPVVEQAPWDSSDFVTECRYLSGDRNKYDAGGRYVSTQLGWYSDLYAKPLHPSVAKMVEGYRPADVARLALEWAHISSTDELRIAYTRNATDGENNRQLVTSIGKYLSRHWPHVPDHIRRDAQALYTPDQRLLVHTTPEMVYTVEEGPRSCMASAHASILWDAGDRMRMLAWLDNPQECPEPTWSQHPYFAYAPEEGWSMAQRWASVDGKRRLDGRALIYKGPATAAPVGVFVRTYARNKSDPVSGWSETDFALHTWLEAQGYSKCDAWPEDAVLRTRILDMNPEDGTPTRIYAPYVDGERRTLSTLALRPGYSKITEEPSDEPGHFNAAYTTGIVYVNGERDSDDYDEDHFTCECCDGRFHDDEHNRVDRDEETMVCTGCMNYEYTEVRGAVRWGNTSRCGYHTYHIPNDDAVEVYRPGHSNYYIDSDHAPDCAVQLDDGDYADSDDVVYLHDAGYVLHDVLAHVALEEGDYALREDACEIDDKFYLIGDCYEAEDGTWFREEDDRDEYDADDTDDEAEAEVADKGVEAVEPAPKLVGTTANFVIFDELYALAA